MLVSSVGTYSLNLFTALGGFVSSMGLILSFVAIMAEGKRNDEVAGDKQAYSHPLSYMMVEIEKNYEGARKSSGNRAFGFVLISMGLFLLAVAGLLGFFIYSWPITLFGAGSAVGGALLFHR